MYNFFLCLRESIFEYAHGGQFLGDEFSRVTYSQHWVKLTYLIFMVIYFRKSSEKMKLNAKGK